MTEFIADLHIHSKYSGGCSRDINIETLSYYAGLKGLSVMATGDFTFKKWVDEIKEKVEFDNITNLYLYKKEDLEIYYVPQSEVNLLIDEESVGTKRIHHIILAPSFEVVDQINEVLSKYGSLIRDARPNLRIQPPEFVEILKNIDPMIEIIPAHIFTPWFGLFGSFSGYDDISECYKEKLPEIHAIETGLSADPTYIYSISQLDKFSIISCSDLHSYYPHRIGREATIFDLKKLSYKEIIYALRTNDERLKMTLEFKPEEGKYNYDGCRGEKHSSKEDIYLHPYETDKNDKCPICKKKIIKGVLNRVLKLSNRELLEDKSRKPFRYIIPLTEIISISYNINSPWSKTTIDTYKTLINKFGSEYNILLNRDIDYQKLIEIVNKDLATNIMSVKNNEFYFNPPGHDGVYGVLNLGKKIEKDYFLNEKKDKIPIQKSLYDFKEQK